MAKNSAVNLDITNNADGFDISGGTTKRKLTLSGADIELTGSGTNTYTYPSTTDTLVGRASTDTLTNKTLTSPTINTPTGITTGDITESTDKNYVTDAEATVIGNTSGTNTGDETTGNLTEATSSVLTIGNGTDSVIGAGTTIEVAQANISTSGYLSASDWTTFNNKGVMNNLTDDESPQLTSNLDLNQHSILYDPTPSSDSSWNGSVISATAGEALSIGDICYLKSDGKYWKIDASAETTAKGMCVMSTGTISADASGIFLLNGFIRYDTWAWTVGAELWCSITPGNPTETKPSATTEIVRLTGYAYSADVVYFNPDSTYIEIV